MSLIAVFEGATDLPVVQKLVADGGLSPSALIEAKGKSRIDPSLQIYNRAAKGSPWFVLRDFDADDEKMSCCVGGFLQHHKFQPAPWMCFRLAVHGLEAWLLADSAATAKFLGVREDAIPREPDLLPYPKRSLVDLARRSRRTVIRQGLVPPSGASAGVGPRYSDLVIEFARQSWDLDRACDRSPSLARARRALRDLGQRWRSYLKGER
jgi:hypothetical protein